MSENDEKNGYLVAYTAADRSLGALKAAFGKVLVVEDPLASAELLEATERLIAQVSGLPSVVIMNVLPLGFPVPPSIPLDDHPTVPPMHEPGPTGAQPDPLITVGPVLIDALIKHCADQGLGVDRSLAERALEHIAVWAGAIHPAPDLPGILVSYAKHIWTNREYHVAKAKQAQDRARTSDWWAGRDGE